MRKQVVKEVKTFKAKDIQIPSIWIAYTLDEGGEFLMLGLDTDEQADEVVELYTRAGIMENPYRHRPGADKYVEPVSMMKLVTDEHHFNLEVVKDVAE